MSPTESTARLKNGVEIFRQPQAYSLADPFTFLAADLYPKWYWEDFEGQKKMAGLGCSYSQEKVPAFESESSSDICFFASRHFSHNTDPLWQSFPYQVFILPNFEWISAKEQTELASYSLTKSESPFLPLSKGKYLKTLPPFYERRDDIPHFEKWKESLLQSLDQMNQKKLEKVVLARRSSFFFDSLLSPLQILQKLKKIKGKSYLFFFQPGPNIAFLGASPEMLYKRAGNKIISCAIAGTRKRGKTEKEDEILKQELLHSAKEQKEFLFVEEFLHQTLSPYCENIQLLGRGSIIKTPYVQHLHSRFQGTLKNSIGDEVLLSSLHPTPATLGKPSKDAMQVLKNIEPLSRGLFAAPIGWINSGQAEFAVGIRSCLIQKNIAHLFAAAGILLGSDPFKEWEELEQKIALFKTGVFHV